MALSLSPLNRRRLANFRANRRGWWSLWAFAALFCVTLFAEFIANDRPLVARVDGRTLFPVLTDYAESDILPDGLPTEVDWHDTAFRREIEGRGGWMVWPLIPYAYNTVVRDLDRPAPAPPSARNWLGTDDQSRDVLARVIYGFRVSVLFGFTLTIAASVIGIAAGAVQGFYGGLTDLLFQRFMEIWSGLPELYLLIILASIVQPSFWILLGFLLLFSWMGLTGVVRAEFLRGRNLDYVRAARALGVSDARLMARHILPSSCRAAWWC
jgi:microcin C transport system permease protein